MSGLIGWSVTVPTLIGAALGIWVDKHYPSFYSWTLMLLLIGLIIGCLNAWHWVDSEYKEMQEEARMSDIPAACPGVRCRLLLGAFFFGGLWWTVQKGVTSETPALWFLGSLLLRTGVDSGWILCCFAGPLVEARGVPPWISDCARDRREAAHASSRRKSRPNWKRRPALRLSPDDLVFWRYGFVELNSTIVTTWVLMLVMTVGAMADHAQARDRSAHLALARLPRNRGHHDSKNRSKRSACTIRRSIWVFWARCFCSLRCPTSVRSSPGTNAPTGSLSTTSALAISVFVAVPLFGIEEQGLGGYLKSYLKPTWIMLPFNIISEVSRTFALAIRLFGNIMSGTMIVGILLTITPLIFPIFMNLLGLLTGMVQAYIFSILATVYIAAATRTREA